MEKAMYLLMESLQVKRGGKFMSRSWTAKALRKFDWWIEYYCGQIPLWHK
jgi:hypothetical protein